MHTLIHAYYEIEGTRRYAATAIDINTSLFADTRRVTSTDPSPLCNEYLLSPMSDGRILVAHESFRDMYTVDEDGTTTRLVGGEQYQAARDALANARQLMRYHEGRVVPFTHLTVEAKDRSDLRAATAAMRYRLTMAYLSLWYGDTILTDVWEHVPPHKL